MKKSKKFISIALVILLLAGAAISFGKSESGSQRYRTDEITRGSITEVVTANGTLNPMLMVNVGTQVSGQVNKVYVNVNDQVKEGQLLAEIDPKLLESQLKQSRANLETARTAYEQAQRDLNRTRMLVEKDYVAKVELERAQQSFLSARNSYDSVKSQVESDEVNLNYTKITSPIDGVVISQDVTLGQTVAAQYQTPNMFKIAGDLTSMKIDVNFSESDIAKIKADMPVTFTVDAYPDREFTGKVQVVNLNPNNQSGVVTYSVTVSVENKEKLLLPGMTAYVTVMLSEVKDVLRVPAAALRFTPPVEQTGGLQRLFRLGMRPARQRGDFLEGSASVYLLKGGEPVPVEVKMGATDETYVEISGNGIAEGNTVITGLTPQRK